MKNGSLWEKVSLSELSSAYRELATESCLWYVESLHLQKAHLNELFHQSENMWNGQQWWTLMEIASNH